MQDRRIQLGERSKIKLVQESKQKHLMLRKHTDYAGHNITRPQQIDK